MSEERTSYRERTSWPGWAGAIFWGGMIICSYPLLAGWDTDLEFPVRVLIVGAVAAAFVGIKFVVGGLTVLVQETQLFVHLGSLRVIKTVIPFSDIVELESVHYRPIMEFGGWGVRGWGKKKAWTARGDQAVVLTLLDDRRIYVGSDHPRRLEERIRAVAGRQLGADV
jgi:hypothetical protein